MLSLGLDQVNGFLSLVHVNRIVLIFITIKLMSGKKKKKGEGGLYFFKRSMVLKWKKIESDYSKVRL